MFPDIASPQRADDILKHTHQNDDATWPLLIIRDLSAEAEINLERFTGVNPGNFGRGDF